MVLGILASVFGGLAALVHVYIFVMESVRWTQPAVFRRFGIPDRATAETIRPMAYNQGFYNLFLAIGAAVGIVLFWAGQELAGRTLAQFALACMAGASIVLLTTGRHYLRAAALQGVLPLIGFVLFLFA
jgi:putative membrane protein